MDRVREFLQHHPTGREFIIALAAIIFAFALLMAGTR